MRTESTFVALEGKPEALQEGRKQYVVHLSALFKNADDRSPSPNIISLQLLLCSMLQGGLSHDFHFSDVICFTTSAT